MRLAAGGVVLLLVAGWLGALHPAFDSIAHFRHHVLLGGALVLPALAWLASWRSFTTLVVVMIVSLAAMWPALPGLSPEGATGDFSVAQQNLLYLNVLPEQAIETLLAADADVLLLQEVSIRNAAILRGVAGEYPHATVCRFRKLRSVAVLSRRPFVGEPLCDGEGGLSAARIELGGRVITFASMHSYWPWPYPQWPTIRGVEDRLRTLPHPLVLGGDFNAAPWSALVRKVARETGTDLVPGFRFTFNLRILQNGDSRFGGLPLDHILHSPELKPTAVRLLPHVGSDHLGTLARFAFAG